MVPQADRLVSYGGRGGGLRVVEQLRQVFCALHRMTIRESISVHPARAQLDEAGRPRDPDAGAAAGSFPDQLTWWALAVREAPPVPTSG